MKYVGSKNRLAKELVPIIQGYIDNMDNCKGYLEPFVGGANMIDKIKCNKKIGCDSHDTLIELLKKTRDDYENIPSITTKEEYDKIRNNQSQYEKWLVGLYEFCASYNSKSWGGYCGDCNTKQGIRHYDQEAIRNLKKQAPNLKGINFVCCDFRDLPKDKINGYVIYCDPPYKDTTKYNTNEFPYEEYYNWVREMSKNNIVLCSEYWMPDDFECIWEQDVRMSLNKNDSKQIRTERLYTYINIK